MTQLSSNMSADDVIAALDLLPHPEGGCYAETFRDSEPAGQRAHSTAIYYLLREGEHSAWHKVDAVEIWHWYAGAPLSLSHALDTGPASNHILGPGLADGQRPQVIIPRNAWQSARSLGQWTLVGCTVSPGFEFEGFVMAPDGWAPDG